MNNEAFRRKSLITVLSVMMVWTMTGCGSGTVKGDDLSAEAPAQSNETAAAQEDQAFEPFIRIDRDDPKASERDLENLRIITKGEYQLSKPKDKYGIDPDIPVNETGLDALNVSASAQFNERQLHILAEKLRDIAPGKEIYIFDFRRESHAFLDGLPFSLYADHNWSNIGLTTEQIEMNEQLIFGALAGTKFQAFAKDDGMRGEMAEYQPERMMSEKELVESEGLQYIRLPIKDHSWPAPEELDTFIEFVRTHDMDNVWMHFHCHAGTGRTGAFMVIIDKMKNPDIPMEDICIRQSYLMSSYMLQTETSDEFKAPLYQEKAERAIQFGQYVEENHASNFALSWSEWLSKQ